MYRGTIDFPAEDKNEVEKIAKLIRRKDNPLEGWLSYEVELEPLERMDQLEPFWGRWVWTLDKVQKV